MDKESKPEKKTVAKMIEVEPGIFKLDAKTPADDSADWSQYRVPERDLSLEEILDKLNAKAFGVEPSDITVEFIHEVRKYMHRDPHFGKGFKTTKDLLIWEEKCKEFGQKVKAGILLPC